MPYPKKKIIRLKGKAYQALRQEIFDRDEGRCVVCGKKATEHHHEPPGTGRKNDTVYTGVALCEECHFQRHNTETGNFLKEKINDYLNQMYGEEVRKEYL